MLAVTQKCWHENRLHGRIYVAYLRFVLVQTAHGVMEMAPIVSNVRAAFLKGAQTLAMGKRAEGARWSGKGVMKPQRESWEFLK